MDSFLPVVGSAVVSISAAIVAFVFARKLGLTAVQRTFAEESARLSTTLKVRVDVLEAENARLKDEVKRLEEENERLQRRVTRLEHDLLELMQEREP